MAISTFEPESFAAANPIVTGASSMTALLGDILKNKMEKIKIKNAPAEAEKLRLANALSQIELGQKPEEYAAINSLRRAQVPLYQSEVAKNYAGIPLTKAEARLKEFQANNPLFSQPGVAGQIASAIYLQQHPELNYGGQQQPESQQQSQIMPALPERVQETANKLAPILGRQPPNLGNIQLPQAQQQGNAQQTMQQRPQTLADLLYQSIGSETNRKNAIANLANTRNEGYAWSSLGGKNKDQEIAQAKALGYTNTEAAKYLSKGHTIQELAVAKGIDPNNMPAPIYAPTAATLSRAQLGNSTVAGLKAIEGDIKDAIAPYSRRYQGISPALIKDVIKGENPEQAGKVLAAYAMQPEVQSLRIRALGGNVGEGAIEKMMQASQNKINTLGLSPNSETYLAMQKYIGQWIEKTNEAENRVRLSYQAQNESKEQADSQEISNDQILNALGGGE